MYGTHSEKKILNPVLGDSGNMLVTMDCSKQFGWYDFTVKITGIDFFEKRYAGKVETGKPGYSDPYMGRIA